jgi:hypothetical protein
MPSMMTVMITMVFMLLPICVPSCTYKLIKTTRYIDFEISTMAMLINLAVVYNMAVLNTMATIWNLNLALGPTTAM